MCPPWEIPPLTGPNGSSSMLFFFSNSNQNPSFNLERLEISKVYNFVCFCYRIIVIVALTLLTSSQSILIVWSKRNGKHENSITTTNFMGSTRIIFRKKKTSINVSSVIYVQRLVW